MEVTNRPVGSLIPYTLNNRTHPAEQVARIANSIAEFGFNQPIVVDEKNVVLVGHGRLMAAQRLGLAEVPTLKLENLSEAKKRAYRILDNKLQNDSEWELDNLKLELQMLEDDGFELEPWGLNSLLPEDETAEVVEDDFEAEDIEEPYIKEGDLIELGEHRVLCGDSTSAEQVALLMNGRSADLVVTDPPYGVSYADKNAFLNAFDEGNRVQTKIENDHLNQEQTQAMWKAAFVEMVNVMRPGASIYCFMPQGGDQMMMMMMMMMNAGIEPRHELIWLKNNHVLGRADYAYKHEPILYAWKAGAGHKFYGEFQTSILEFAKPQKSDLHPTMKPIPLLCRLISNNTKREELVYEPFCGSGSTLIAAEQLGRKCYGMEISPKYCQVILERYKAHCEKEGKPFVCRINGEAFDGDVRA